MQTRQLKIVVSGPVGAGKTSLVKALAEHFALPVIEEGMKPIHAAQSAYNALKKSPQSGGDDVKKALKVWMDAFSQWADDRTRLYDEHQEQGFVADRWEADLLDFWLKVFVDLPCDRSTMRLFENMRQKARGLDLAIHLPLQDLGAETRNEDGLVRRQGFNPRFMSSLMTGALIRQCPGLRLLVVPNKPLSVDERVALIASAIARHRTFVNASA